MRIVLVEIILEVLKSFRIVSVGIYLTLEI